MGSNLTIHVASSEEVVAAHRNVFDIWSKGLSLDDHIRYRLESPSHKRAKWFVGCVDGRVVTSLGCYPLRFRLLGQELSGIAIGSVYTLREFRGHGFAPQLLEWVEDYQCQRRAALSVLYSDIGPDYYARLGYVLCPSLEGWCDPRDSLADFNATHRMVRFSAQASLADIMNLYAAYHGAVPLSIARDAAYWSVMLKKFPGDEFYSLEAPNGTWAGYLRVGRKDDTWRITDFALQNQSEELAEDLYAAFLSLARSGGAHRAGGWLPDSPGAKKFFELTPRKTEITMIKPLANEWTLREDAIAGTSRFCEIDHV
jgi:predicted N-acetyltransferase YhbS